MEPLDITALCLVGALLTLWFYIAIDFVIKTDNRRGENENDKAR